MSAAALPDAFSPDVRRAYLGGSEVAGALGLSRWKTPIGVWSEKVGITPPLAESDVLEWGHLLEPVILDRWSRKMRTAIVRPTEAEPLEVRHSGGWLRGHLDGLAAAERTCPDCGTVGTPILEAKAPGLRTAHFWGPPCSDLVPDDYGVQAQVYMGLTGRDQCDLYAPIGGPDWRVYHLHFDQELYASLVAGAGAFWRNYVQTGQRPPLDASASTAEYLAHAFPRAESKKMAQPTPESNTLAARLRHARAELAKWEAEKTQAEHELKAMIGARAGIAGPDYSIAWSNCKGSVGKAAYVEAVEALVAQHAALLEHVIKLELCLPMGLVRTPAEILAEHLKPSAGYRRFVPKFTNEGGES